MFKEHSRTFIQRSVNVRKKHSVNIEYECSGNIPKCLCNAQWLFENNIQWTLNTNIQGTFQIVHATLSECLKKHSVNIEYECSGNVPECLCNAQWMFENNIQQTLNVNVQVTFQDARAMLKEWLKLTFSKHKYQCSRNVLECSCNA